MRRYNPYLPLRYAYRYGGKRAVVRCACARIKLNVSHFDLSDWALIAFALACVTALAVLYWIGGK